MKVLQKIHDIYRVKKSQKKIFSMIHYVLYISVHASVYTRKIFQKEMMQKMRLKLIDKISDINIVILCRIAII